MAKLVNRRQTNRRVGEEWYTCNRCGLDYPRSDVAVQNGLILCRGPNTTQCWDEPGFAAELKNVRVPREKPIPSLPQTTEDL